MTAAPASFVRRALLRRIALTGLTGLATSPLATALAANASPAAAPDAASAASAGSAAALPGDSLWQLPVALDDQDGHAFRLASLRGSPVLASMFYASCDMVCPLIFETVAATLAAAGPAAAARARVLMVTFDPARDTVAVLKRTAADHHAGPRWTLARGSDAAARQVAAVLGIQYRRLEGGSFNHSSTISLLDAEGRVAARSARLGEVDAPFAARLAALAR